MRKNCSPHSVRMYGILRVGRMFHLPAARAAGWVARRKSAPGGSTMNATQPVHATQEKTETKNGRQANGRFAPGNPGGPGNPYARQVAEYQKATLAVVSIERLKRILDAIAKKAEDGDMTAAKLILHYTLGKPTASVDPDQVDV